MCLDERIDVEFGVDLASGLPPRDELGDHALFQHGPLILLGTFAVQIAEHFDADRLTSFTASVNLADHELLNELLDTRQVVPVLGRTFALDEVTALLELQASGRVAGKAVLIPRRRLRRRPRIDPQRELFKKCWASVFEMSRSGKHLSNTSSGAVAAPHHHKEKLC